MQQQSTNCSGSPKVCAPLWTTTGPPVSSGGAAGSLAIANGVVYVGADGTLFAFDANGSTNCSGAPKVCAPLWTGAVPGAIYSSPSVANGTVFLGDWTDGKLYAFDATGVTNCSGAPKTCAPLWTAATPGSIGATAAIANGVVYVVSGNGTLAAFDATGTSGCSGHPKTCTPLWTFAPGGSGYVTSSSPAVANGVVYFVSVTGTLYAVDATGTTGCSGVPKTCTSLWSASSGKSGDGSPAVVNGVVYVDVWGNNTVYAYSL